MAALLACMLALGAAAQNGPTPAAELRAALEAMRDGAPGEPAFESALPRLPELIRSRSTDLVPGGAYLAGEHGRKECVPALLDALDAWDDLDALGRRCVLDGLIRLEARVAPGRLPLAPWYEVECYLLLARDPELHRDELRRLLDACEPDERARWACAVTLARVGDPRLAQRLFSDGPWPFEVAVRDPGSSAYAGGGTSVRRISCGRPTWPPRIHYELLLPVANEPLPMAVSARRSETRGSCRTDRGPFTEVQRAEWRTRLLGELLGEPPPTFGERRDVEWGGFDAFAIALRESVGDRRARIERVALALEARGLLEGAVDVAAGARFRITLRDLREEHSSALPRPDLGPGVIYD